MDFSRRDALVLLGAAALGPMASSPAGAAPGQLYPIHDPVPFPGWSVPRIVARATNGFVVAASGSDGLRIARFTALSEPESPPQTLPFPGTPEAGCQVVVLPSGSAVVIFSGVLAAAPGNRGVFAMPFSDAGVTTGPAIRINLASSEQIQRLSARRLTDGSVLVAWQDGVYKSERVNVRWRIVGASGAPRTSVKTITRVSGLAGHLLLAAAALPDGEALIAYMRDDNDVGPGPVFLQKIDASGAAAGAAFKLGVTTFLVDLASTPEGAAAIWATRVEEGQDADICLRKIRADGVLGRVKSTSVGFYFVNSNSTANFGPKLTRAADGRFVALVAGWDDPPPYAYAVADNYVKAFVFNESLGYNSQHVLAFARDHRDTYLTGDAIALQLLSNGSLVAGYWSGRPTYPRYMQRMRLI